MSVVLVCGSSLKVFGFDYQPDLTVNLTNVEDDYVEKRTLVVSSFNQYSSSENATENNREESNAASVELEIDIISTDHDIHPSLYIIYFLLPILMSVILFIMNKDKIKVIKDGTTNENHDA